MEMSDIVIQELEKKGLKYNPRNVAQTVVDLYENNEVVKAQMRRLLYLIDKFFIVKDINPLYSIFNFGVKKICWREKTL